MADTTETDETPDERETQEEAGATPEEAHRVGEFDDLRDALAGLGRKIDALSKIVIGAGVESVGNVSEKEDDYKVIDIDSLDL